MLTVDKYPDWEELIRKTKFVDKCLFCNIKFETGSKEWKDKLHYNELHGLTLKYYHYCNDCQDKNNRFLELTKKKNRDCLTDDENKEYNTIIIKLLKD